MSATITRLVDLMKASGKTEFTRNEVIDIARANGLSPEGFLNMPTYRVRRGVYGVPALESEQAPTASSAVETFEQNADLARTKAVEAPATDNALIPVKDGTYVPFGFFKDLATIIHSRHFYPVFITGLSGNGKTTMVEQACAALKREAVRVNISIETDEDDLIGGNTLVNGNIVYREGPVFLAMKRGAILILDECDRGSNKMMCLQAILEGKPYFNKKTGETIHPAPGFNIIATANTKGQGSDEGKYMSAQILDDAFLERFAITVEQEYPSSKVEKKILMKKMARANKVDEDFADKLVQWAEIIRKTFKDGAIDELVSTRRLEHIVNAYAMFDNRLKAINLCIARFNEETKASFVDLYTKVDPNPDQVPDVNAATAQPTV